MGIFLVENRKIKFSLPSSRITALSYTPAGSALLVGNRESQTAMWSDKAVEDRF